jgi:hypothetical protein
MSAERQLNPSDLSDQALDRFLFALMGRLNKYYTNGIEVPLTKSEIAEFGRVTERQIDKLVDAGKLTAHRHMNGGDPRFYASEYNASLGKK